MAQWVAIHGYGAENLEPDVLNRPVRELTERTNWLYEQLQNMLGSGTFESVRVLNAALDVDSEYAPSVGDFVQLDRTTRKYAQALATISDTDVFTASPQAYAVGLLTTVNSDGTGTIVLYGKAELATSGTGWDLSGMMEPGEDYRNGTYYLSSTTAGKITAAPSGVAIYLGQFQDLVTNVGYGGFVLLNPQYRDTGEAHIHRAYPLYPQPVGENSTDGTLPISTHTITGFDPTTPAAPTDLIPRLLTLGTWMGGAATQYSMWLSGSSDPNEVYATSSDPANSWTAVYLHWTSSDPAEDGGAVRVWAFETPLAVGSKGLLCALEAMTSQPNDEPFNPVAGSDIAKRTWVITAPDMTRGWLARKTRLYLDDHPATDGGYSFMLKGGPYTSTDARPYETVTVKCGDLHNITYTGQPLATESIVFEGTTFEFYSTTYAGTDVGVVIGVDADTTYANLMTAILAQNLTGVDAALSVVNGALVVLLPTAAGITGTLTNATVPLTASYTGAGTISGAGTAGVLVYDQYHVALVDAAPAYWTGFDYWDEATLINNLTLMVLPYDSDGTAASADTMVADDYWSATFSDEAPGAAFDYAIGMHPALSQYYPPIPRNAGTLVLNGVELASYDLFPESASYHTGMATLSWFSDGYGTVPYPRDWVSAGNPGSSVYNQNLLYHLVRMAAGNVGLVTSVRPASGSPIRVLQCGTTEPASTGDLELDLDLNLGVDDAELAGYRVVKTVAGQKMVRGPVVERIKAGSGILISQTAGAGSGQGTVTVSSSVNEFGGEFDTVALENAKQEVIGMFPYIRLLGWDTGSGNNIPTAFIGKFRVPHSIGADQLFRVVIYATVFGEQDIPWSGGGSPLFAGLSFEYTILPDYVSIEDEGSIAWNALTDGMLTMTIPIQAEVPLGLYDPLNTTDPIYQAYDPMLVHNDDTLVDDPRRRSQVLGNPFPEAAALAGWSLPEADTGVRAGSLVGIRISRANVLSPAQEYTGSVGFINLRWKLVTIE